MTCNDQHGDDRTRTPHNHAETRLCFHKTPHHRRTWLDNCADKTDDLRAEVKKAFDHAELDATAYAHLQFELDELDAFLTIRNERNKA